MNKLPLKRLSLGLILASVSLNFSSFAAAPQQTVSASEPQQTESQTTAISNTNKSINKHMGVATCASSVCHGSPIERKDGNILQNEYVIWGSDDAHSKAYSTLRSDKSKSIARKLGLESAETAKICLDCHTDMVPKSLQGKRFLKSDGVGCEACHGGSEHWLNSHTAGDHQQNLRNGLVQLDNIQLKVKLHDYHQNLLLHIPLNVTQWLNYALHYLQLQ